MCDKKEKILGYSTDSDLYNNARKKSYLVIGKFLFGNLLTFMNIINKNQVS